MELSAEFLEKYGLRVVKSSVGEGGSAVVHRCEVVTKKVSELPDAGDAVAVKAYKPSVLTIPNQLARIRQEGDLGCSIDNDNLVRTYLSHVHDTEAYLFMEWVDGTTLDNWSHTLRKNASWDKLRSVAEGIMSGLAALHAKEILHRDIKPENVMVVDDAAKLMDIGVAELTSDSEHTLHTTVEQFVGSVRYASPQFISGEKFHPKDDVYSLGATLLELFSGKRPYENVERKPVLPIKVVEGPPKLEELRPNVPAHMRLLVEGCLQRERDRRPTLAQMKDVFEQGEQSGYLKIEAERRNTEARGHKILRADDSSGGFYADVGSDEPRLSEEYTVVRRDSPLHVPSLGTSISPEMWIASAELRHVHNNVGYFKLLDKVWVQDRTSNKLLSMFGGGGHWKDVDKRTLDVRVGDFVLRGQR